MNKKLLNRNLCHELETNKKERNEEENAKAGGKRQEFNGSKTEQRREQKTEF